MDRLGHGTTTTGANLFGAVWRKSSRSSSEGPNCVEIAEWRRSKHSGDNGGDCVEVADLERMIAVRDSKDPEGPKLIFAPGVWGTLAAEVKAGLHDL